MASPLGIADVKPNVSEAFEELYRAHYSGLCHTVYGYVRSRDTARELVQDLFLRVWDGITTRHEPLPTPAYLYVAARNRALRAIRHRQVESRWEERQGSETPVESSGPDHAIAGRELADAVATALGDLPERCRLVFTLSRHDHLKNAEIAARLGISVSTVEQQMWRALKALRVKLGPYLPVILGIISVIR